MKLDDFNILEIGEYTTKTHLATLLKISTRTIYQYHKLALQTDEFLTDYPTLDNEYYNTSSSLTRYQVWVIYMLMLCAQRVPKSQMLETDANNKVWIKQSVNARLSKSEYQRFLNVQSNIIDTLMKVA